MLDITPENLLRSIFHTLAYADVFDYPLTAGEVNRYLINYDCLTAVCADGGGYRFIGYE